MLSRIKPNRRISISLHYNEKKVINGKAERIAAEGFLKDHDRLSKNDILDRFRQRSSFNERLHDHGAHITLNFGKTETLDNATLANIANNYMTGTKLGDEPYVVYRHHDAGHTHLHVLVTTVTSDGRWIRFEPGDYYHSHALCKKLETEFSLEKNKKHSLSEEYKFGVDHAQRITYGEPGLTRAISDVLNTVYHHYNYTSLDEFNAILKQYNVRANPGQDDSRLKQLHGLQYHALDSNGNSIGVPLKASLFAVKPTLKRLEQKFVENHQLRESSREHLHTAIEWALAGRAPDWPGFVESLEKEGIAVVTNKTQEGKETLFFVDHVKKAAFTAASLGPAYLPEALRNRCAPEEQITQQQIQEQRISLHL